MHREYRPNRHDVRADQLPAVRNAISVAFTPRPKPAPSLANTLGEVARTMNGPAKFGHPDVIEPNVEAVDDATAKRLLAGYSDAVVNRGLDKLLGDIDLIDHTDGHIPPADWRVAKLLADAADAEADRHISGTRADDGNGFDFIDHTPRA